MKVESFYSECSQVSSPQSGVKDESCESYFDDTGSDRSRVGPLSHSVTANSSPVLGEVPQAEG